jgi:hypothetical protein
MKRLAMYRRTVESTVAAASQLIVRRETSQPVALGNPDLFRELRGGARKSSREPEEKKCEPRDVDLGVRPALDDSTLDEPPARIAYRAAET